MKGFLFCGSVGIACALSLESGLRVDPANQPPFANCGGRVFITSLQYKGKLLHLEIKKSSSGRILDLRSIYYYPCPYTIKLNTN